MCIKRMRTLRKLICYPTVLLIHLCKMVLNSSVKHFYCVGENSRKPNLLHAIKKKIPLQGNYQKILIIQYFAIHTPVITVSFPLYHSFS